jgi:GTP-binding protein of the ras superfamily involved in termination of M-phase
MVKYVNNTFDTQYRKTLGVNFMERNIELGTTDISFAIYDVGGGPEFINMLPVATKDASAVIYVFDLTDKKTLDHLREWYKLSKESNQNATPMLVGTKYDKLVGMDLEYQEEIHKLSLKFARAMGASIVFTSTSDSINVQKVFKILISKVFDLQIRIPEIRNVGEPLLLHRLQ